MLSARLSGEDFASLQRLVERDLLAGAPASNPEATVRLLQGIPPR